MRTLLLWILLWSAAGRPACGAVYNFALGDPDNRTVRMNIPASVPVVRGLLIWGNGSNSDLRSMATDPEMVALGESLGFAIIGTSMWSNFALGYNPSEYSGWEYTLERLAAMSGHPEIVRAPWLPVGQSNGGCMSYGLNALAPEKTIVCTVNKGRVYNIPRPNPAALRTPGLLLSGGIDTLERRTNIRDLFDGNRPRGALWAWVEEEMSNHNYGDSFELLLPFAAEICRLRYPGNASPLHAPVTLSDLNVQDGWLADTDSYQDGFVTIAPYASYAKDPSRAGWLPNRWMAYIFRAFASHDLARYETSLSSGPGPVAWGTRVTYAIGEPVRDWSAIEFFEGDILLRRTTPAEAGPLAVDHYVTRAGYAVFHALITFVDGTRRPTMIRRVFVRAPAAGAAAGNAAVAIDGATTITAAVPSPAVASSRWQLDTGAGWRSLSDGDTGGVVVEGAFTPMVTLSRVSAALDGARLRCSFSNNTTSVPVTFAVGIPPAVLLVQAAPAQPVMAGTTVTMSVQNLPAGVSYQWYRNRVTIAGATTPALSLLVGAADAGTYQVIATANDGLSTSVDVGTLAVESHAWLANLSARARAGTDADMLIAGFYTNSPAADAGKSILVRGIGPTLSRPPFSVPGVLADAQLQMFDAAGQQFAATTSWAPELATDFARLGAFPLEAGSGDAAMLAAFGPGIHTATASLSPASGSAGVGLIELYDADGGVPGHRLVNLSARARAGSGANAMFGGFVVHGTSHQTVLVRAVGLGLRLFLDEALLSPVLTVRDSQARVIAINRGRFVPAQRGDSLVAAEIGSASNRLMTGIGAFLLPMPQMSGYEAGWDSALVLTLPPGSYTAEVSGDAGASGTALVEIFEVE